MHFFCMTLFCIQKNVSVSHRNVALMFLNQKPLNECLTSEDTLELKQYFLHNGICYWDIIIRTSCCGQPSGLASAFHLFFQFHCLSLSPLHPPPAHTCTFFTPGSLSVCWPTIKGQFTSVFPLYVAFILLFFCSFFLPLFCNIWSMVYLLPAS